MQQPLLMAQQALLAPADLTEDKLQSVLNRMLGKNIDLADIYLQTLCHESWSLEDGIVKDGAFNVERGVGIRVVSGEKTGFAYADDIHLPALQQAADAARSITQAGSEGKVAAWRQESGHTLYPVLNPLGTLTENQKIELLQRIDAEARRYDPRVIQVMISLSGTHEIILIMNSEGILTADVRPLVRLGVSVIAEQAGRREHGYAGGGGRSGYEFFLEQELALSYAREAVQQALVNLEAIPAPAGTMPIVLASGWPGVLLHEAVGHGLEGDFNRKGSSAFANRLGTRVAAPGCTVVDDGTLPGRRGSLNIDDEGTPTQCTVLIEDGILRGYMQDKLNARLMNTQPTGNGRRESYAHLPIPRMTNTYMLPGKYTPEEIIASVDRGLYAVNFAGGQVDTTSGKFVFSTSEAYLIEKGKITRPVKGATLIGNGPDVLTKVSMLGNDLKLDGGIGTCGKDGQSVPVGVGLPTLRVDALTVGGTH
ncbi:MAG: metalloprotease TldD [Gammaproteobacteria bacterium]